MTLQLSSVFGKPGLVLMRTSNRYNIFPHVATCVSVVPYSQGSAVKLTKRNNMLRLYCRWLICCQSVSPGIFPTVTICISQVDIMCPLGHRGPMMRVWSCCLTLPPSEWIMKPSQGPAQSHTGSRTLCVSHSKEQHNQNALEMRCIQFQRCLTDFCSPTVTTVTLLTRCSRQASEAAELLTLARPHLAFCLWGGQSTLNRRISQTWILINIH